MWTGGKIVQVRISVVYKVRKIKEPGEGKLNKSE